VASAEYGEPFMCPRAIFSPAREDHALPKMNKIGYLSLKKKTRVSQKKHRVDDKFSKYSILMVSSKIYI